MQKERKEKNLFCAKKQAKTNKAMRLLKNILILSSHFTNVFFFFFFLFRQLSFLGTVRPIFSGKIN
jgi:hypothetical protein